MKKIIRTIYLVAFVLLAMPIVAHAQAFNTDPKDMRTTSVANTTNGYCNAGSVDGCWKSSVIANPGDRISVHVYYHNSGSVDASNVAVGLTPMTTNTGSSATFTGRVLVNGSTVASGSASVSFSGASQNLTFIPGTIRWYPNQTTAAQSISNEARLFSTSGVTVGDVSTGWAEQGSFVADFRVSNNTVIIPPNPTFNSCSLDLSTNTYSVYQGNPATLSWYSTNCYNLQLTGFGTVGSSGTQTVYPNGTMTYYLTGQGDNGTVQDSVTININGNNNNNNYCSVYNFDSSRTSMSRGDSAVLRWSTDASYVTISSLAGTYSASSSATVYPSTSTTYTLTAYCNNGYTRTATQYVSVNNASTSTAQVITTSATVLSSTSARLNGLTVPNNNGNTTAWFEYGVTGSLGNRTNPQSVSAANSNYYNDVVTGLSSNTRYYYRAVMQNQSGTVYGDIVPFQTRAISTGSNTTNTNTNTTNTIIRTIRTQDVVNNTVTAQSAPSLLELKVNSQYDRMCVNGDMQYTVTYRNISSTVLRNTVLRITHPRELTFIASTLGKYDVVDRAVTIDLGDVAPNQSGIVVITLKVNSDAVQGNLAVTTATVVYTNSLTNGQEDATAYSLINVSNDCPTVNTLGATAFGTSFLPHTLLEWLLLILVILGLILLARQLYKKNHQV